MLILRLLLISLFTSVLTARFTLADALTDLVKSPSYSEFELHSGKVKKKFRKKENWIDPQSEFGSIFQNNQAPDRLMDWVAPSTPGYTKFGQQTHKEPSMAQCEAKFAARDDSTILTLEIIVPHPRFLNSANLNLLKEFAKLRKEPANLQSTEHFTVRGIDAAVWRTKQESCSMTLNLNAGAILSLSTPQCGSTKRLVDFARSLDIPRLNRKLTN